MSPKRPSPAPPPRRARAAVAPRATPTAPPTPAPRVGPPGRVTTAAWLRAHGVTVTIAPAAPTRHLTPTERAAFAQHVALTLTCDGRTAVVQVPELRACALTPEAVLPFVALSAHRVLHRPTAAAYRDGHSERLSLAEARRTVALYSEWRDALTAVLGEAAALDFMRRGGYG